METIKIVYVVPGLGRDGPTRQLYNLITHLNLEHFKAEIITLSPSSIDNLESDFLELGVAIHKLSLSRVLSILIGKYRLISALQNLKPNLIHSHGFRPDWLLSRISGPYQRISTQRNNPLEDYPPLVGRLKGSIAARIHYYALSRIPIVVACSQAIADTNIPYGITSTVIHNGTNFSGSNHYLNHNEKTEVRTMLGLPKTGRLALFAGPLIARKNPELLIRAFLHFSKEDYSLIILGDGPLLAHCRNLAKNATNIFLPGKVHNVSDYLQITDLFVSASRSEGMPNGVLEALSFDVPVLLSDICAHKEILDLSPCSGLLFKLDDDVSLLDNIKQTMNRPKPQNVAGRLIQKHFSANKMSMGYQHLYQQLILKKH